MTLSQVLDQIYRRHGVYLESLQTITLPGMKGAKAISNIMERLRQDPLQEIAGVKVAVFKDLKSGEEMKNAEGSFTPAGRIPLPSSNVLQFVLEDGSKASARPSGTEPKIKFYFSVPREVSSQSSDEELRQAKEYCRGRLAAMEATFSKLFK